MTWTTLRRRAETALAALAVVAASLLTAIATVLAVGRPAVAQLMLSAITGSFLWTTIAVFAVAAVLWVAVSVWARGRGPRALFRLTSAMAVLTLAGGASTYALQRVAYSRSTEFFAGRDGVRLGGTLYTPSGRGPHPAIVIAPGAGSNPRELYDLYADHFARLGFVVLNPDKRGVGISAGRWSDIDDSEANTMTRIVDIRAHDVASAVDAVAARSDVIPDSIGLFAVSQGGWVAPVAVARTPRVAFMILQSTPTVTSAEERLWGELTGEEKDHFGFQPPDVPFEEADRQLDTMTVRAGYDPVPHWKNVRVPALWLFGEWDKSIPASRSARRVEEWRAAGAPYQVVVLPEANHGLMIARGPRKKRLAYPAPGLWATIDHWLAPGAAHVAAQGASAGAANASYRLRFFADDVRRIAVTAELTPQDSLLYMVPYGAEHLADGWRTFVENERAVDDNGREVSLKRIDGRKWLVSGEAGRRLLLSYDIAVEHDRNDWKPDAREGGYALPSRTFIVGRGLFILPSLELPQTQVAVDLPAGWGVSVPWEPAGKGTFVAATRRDLVESVILAGDFAELDVREGEFTVSYALGKEFSAAAPLFRDMTQRLLREHVATFGGPPAWKRMQVVVNPDPLRRGGGGGVFRRSISMTFTQTPDASSVPTWGHTLSHEIVHVWNAYTLVRASPAEEWILEGGGDYFGVLALARAGFITWDAAFWKMGHAYRRWSRDVGKISLADAGEQEATALGNNALYAGGWTTLFALDIDLRSRSGGTVTLAHVMRAVYQRVMSGEIDVVSNRDYLAALATVSGRDYAPFFTRFVTGKELLPLQEYLPRIGLRFEANGSIQPDPQSSAAARALLASYTAPSPP
jgi:predicted metalloprotease with PDZ domain/dienelactone hydrolase